MTKHNAHLYLPILQALAEGKTIQYRGDHSGWIDSNPDTRFNLGLDPENYRIKPDPVKVPLGPEDVPPGSVFRWIDQKHSFLAVWYSVAYVLKDNVCLFSEHREAHPAWKTLKDDWEINRSLPETGKWDSSDWKPCWKEGGQE